MQISAFQLLRHSLPQFLRSASIVCFLVTLNACATRTEPSPSGRDATTPHHKIGAPYQVNGRLYVPKADPNYEAVGVASWYGAQFHGKATANGERFDRNRLSAAHPTLPLPSLVEVRNLDNGRRLIVRVNDRGPFVADRLIDLSEAAAKELGFHERGLARVKVRYVGPADLPQAVAAHGRQQRAADYGQPTQPPNPRAPTDIAWLIERHADVYEPVGYETWVELASFASGGDLESRLTLDANLGPAAVASMEVQGQRRSSLRIGPFATEQEATSALAASRRSGYPNARLVSE